MHTSKRCCSGNVAQSSQTIPNITEIERNNGELIDAQVDMRLPCSKITDEAALGPMCKVVINNGGGRPSASLHPAFAKSTGRTSQLIGYNFNRSAMITWSKIRELDRECSAGAIWAPNTSFSRHEYTE